MKIFVTAIGTDSGKTVFSAILATALEADYWKPIQAGFPTDRDQVQNLVGSSAGQFFPERYLLKTPASPHAAARIDGVEIKLSDFKAPAYQKHLVIEGAGGAMVPINDHEMVIDLVAELEAQVILVSNLYLGSINHTLLTVELFKNRGIQPIGIVFNGKPNPGSENLIVNYSGYPVLLRILPEKEITSQTILRYAEELRSNWPKAVN